MAVQKLRSAHAAGCTAVLKPAPTLDLTATYASMHPACLDTTPDQTTGTHALRSHKSPTDIAVNVTARYYWTRIVNRL
ncbi:MAG TPA: hypothetical protein VII92_08600 [Anaerolineae bacterium]